MGEHEMGTDHATTCAARQHLLHKALRHCLFDTLVRVGSAELADEEALADTLRRVRRAAALLRRPCAQVRRALEALAGATVAPRPNRMRRLYAVLAGWTTAQLGWLASEERRARGRGRDATPLAPGAWPTLAVLDEAELREALHWMAAALTPQELAALLGELLAAGHSAQYRVALEALSIECNGERFDRLLRSLGIPQVLLPRGGTPRLALAA